LIENNFMGKEGQTVPEMTDEWLNAISNRYIELFEKLTGNKFYPETFSDQETEKKIVSALENFQKI